MSLAVLGGWLLISLSVAGRIIKRAPFDLFRLAPRWNLFSAGQGSGQAAMAIYYIDTLTDGAQSSPVCLTNGIRYWRPWVPFWSASLARIVIYRRLAKSLVRRLDRDRLREDGAYQRLIHLVMQEPNVQEGVSRRVVIRAERTESEPEILFESPDEPL